MTDGIHRIFSQPFPPFTMSIEYAKQSRTIVVGIGINDMSPILIDFPFGYRNDPGRGIIVGRIRPEDTVEEGDGIAIDWLFTFRVDDVGVWFDAVT